MTNEEAKRNLAYAKRWGDKPDDEALEMAIKALEQQPCEDTVSRESVIEWLKDKDIIKTKKQEENARRELGELPSITSSYNSVKTELKPCEDCISREEVMRILKTLYEFDEIKDLKAKQREVMNLPSVTPQASEEDIHREREQAYMLGYEDASKKFRTEPCEDCISREQAVNELKLAYFNKDLQSAKDDPCIVDAMTDWAIRIIKRLPSVTPSNDAIREAYIKGYDYGVKDWFKAKTEPCEDCVSREEAIKQCGFGMTHLLIADCLRNLPSVEPHPKIGHWIDVKSYSTLWHECSECGETEYYATDYCPNCGARMESGVNADGDSD